MGRGRPQQQSPKAPPANHDSAGYFAFLQSRNASGSELTGGNVKQKVEPSPGPLDSPQILPPCRVTMRLTKAKPIPVPSAVSRRSKSSKIFLRGT